MSTATLGPTPSGRLIVPAQEAAVESPIRLSLVLPTYNESQNVGPIVEQIDALLAPVLGSAYEIIVIDDDSPDRTWEVALGLSAKYPCLRVLRRQGERGLSTAVIRGWQAARGDILGVMDADLQHPVDVNLKLLAEIERGADLAAASRHIEGGGVSDWSATRRLLSRGAQLLGLLILPNVLGRVSDPMSGYFMLRRTALAGVELDPLGYKILIEVLGRASIDWISEVGYVFRERVAGESKVSWRLYLQYLSHLLKLRLFSLRSSRLLRYCVVGASGVLVDMAVLFLLSDPSTLAWGLTRSKAIAAECAIASNFLLNDAWTFGDLSRKEPGVYAKFRRFLGFNAICLVGLMLNVVILNFLFNYAHTNRYLANAVAILLVTSWNYFFNRKLNWSTAAFGPRRSR